jgi:hypothetical protein
MQKAIPSSMSDRQNILVNKQVLPVAKTTLPNTIFNSHFFSLKIRYPSEHRANYISVHLCLSADICG